MKDNWKTTTLILGTVLGALTGAGAAFLMIQRAEKEQTKPKFTPGEGIQLGLGVLGLLRLIAGFSTD
jgi:hypothetical protein